MVSTVLYYKLHFNNCEDQRSNIMLKALTSEPSLPLFYGYNSFKAPQFILKWIAFLCNSMATSHLRSMGICKLLLLLSKWWKQYHTVSYDPFGCVYTVTTHVQKRQGLHCDIDFITVCLLPTPVNIAAEKNQMNKNIQES